MEDRVRSLQGGRWRAELLLILALSIPFIFLGGGSMSFLDPDEGMYGTIAREMAEGGDWITPHFNGVRYLEKPPLYFWLTGFTTVLFGPSEWAVRIWSALPALGTAILIWRLGGLLYGGAAGLLAAIVMVSNVGFFRYVRVTATDSLLVFSLTLAMYGFIKAAHHFQESVAKGQRSTVNPHAIILFYLGIALGVLSKGLIGLVFPLLIVGFFSLFALLNNQWRNSTFSNSLLASIRFLFMSRYTLLGVLVLLALILPWHILTAWKNPGFFHFYVVDNQFLRFLNSRAFIDDDVPVSTIAFLLLTFVWFFPWSLFLSAAFRQGFPCPRLEHHPAEHLRLLVGLWAVTIIGFFSLSSSKLEHYFLPAIPPLSLMIGGLWAEAIASPKSVAGLKRWLGVGVVGCSLFGVFLLLFSDLLTPKALFTGLAELNVSYRILQAQGAASPFPLVSPFVGLLKGLAGALLIGLPLSFLFLHFRKPMASFASVLGIAGVIAFLVFKLLLIIEPYHSSKYAAEALISQSGPQDPIVHEGSLEYSGGLPFYTGRRIYVLNGRQGDLDFGSHYPETKYLFLDNKKFTRLWESDRRVFLVTRRQEKESIIKKLSVANVHFLGRYGSLWLYSNNGS